jgi:hypothetical protein
MWTSEIGGDRDLAGDMIDGEADPFTGFETENTEVCVDHVHPGHAGLIGTG